MGNIFVSYRGQERSRVREVEKDLKNSGLCHSMIDDLDIGNLTHLGANEIWKDVENLIKKCNALILLIGDTTHSPKATLNHELDFAISKSWYIFGIQLTNRTGSPSEKVQNYTNYISIDNYVPSEIVKKIHTVLPCKK